jgi:hypothetical protein
MNRPMNRPWSVLRWRHLRWVVCAAAIPALWACTARKLKEPVGGPSVVVKNRFQQSVNRDLDLLFLIDDSSSMSPLQQKMRDRLPDFMNVLKGLKGGLPNMHVAVVSSSLGAGAFGNVSGCYPNSGGNLEAKFQHAGTCTALHSGQNFISSLIDPAAPGGRQNNFDGDITDVFSCIANLGDKGCGFEHQFEATRAALEKAQNPSDPDNAGFLRRDAYLAIVMLTNEDDCSVPAGSQLFDPSVETLGMTAMLPNPLAGTQLGGLQSYRCNEFGHLCDVPGMAGMKAPPPHSVTANVMLNNCVSAEGAGKLVTVEGFVTFLKSLKASPDQILVAALSGPKEPYTVQPHTFSLMMGGSESQPQLAHSCTSGSTGLEYADPGIRIRQFLDAFGLNGVSESICANDFAPAMMRIADVIGRALGVQCVPTNVAMRDDGVTPDCDVTQRVTNAAQQFKDTPVAFCPASNPPGDTSIDKPCWRFGQGTMANAQCPANSQLLELCFDATCSAVSKPLLKTDALVSCALMP